MRNLNELKAFRVLKLIYKALNHVFRIVLLAFILYSIAFSLACTYAAYRAYNYATAILEEVEELKTKQPEQSAFMKSLGKIEIKHTYVSLDNISPYMQKAVVAGEDAGFYFHPGFDVRAIAEALEVNQRKNKTTFGASTITQQLAKNLFLSNERSWERKFKELAYTILMEKYLGKDRILELYLNYAQWGTNIFGCEEAAQNFYKKSCSKLNVDQAINLVAMLASPGRHHPEMKESRFMQERRNMIYRNMFPKKDSLLVDSLRSLTMPAND